MLHDADVPQPDPVPTPEARPPILPLEKSRAERRGQLGVPREVPDRPQTQPGGARLENREGVGIVEAERIADRQALRRESLPDGFRRAERGVLHDDP